VINASYITTMMPSPKLKPILDQKSKLPALGYKTTEKRKPGASITIKPAKMYPIVPNI
jgi:hypothetical protein